jgi:cysteine synthase
MPEGYGAVKARIMEAFGATVIRTPAEKLMSGSIERAKQIVADTPGAFLPNQFSNPVNPRTHFETTGPEIARALEGHRIDAIAMGVGTSGTFTGIARYLRQSNAALLRVAVEPQGSILGGGERGPHQVEGIGLSFWPEILDRSVIDEVLKVTDAEAFAACRELAEKEGLLAGGSSGAAVEGARRVARRLSPDQIVVTLLPDGAERYPDQGIFGR